MNKNISAEPISYLSKIQSCILGKNLIEKIVSNAITINFILVLGIGLTILLINSSHYCKDKFYLKAKLQEQISKFLLALFILIYVISWIILVVFSFFLIEGDKRGINIFDNILTSFTRSLSSIFVTILICILTLSLWRIPKGILTAVLIILSVRVIVYFLNSLKILQEIIGIFALGFYFHLIFDEVKGFKEKFSSLLNDIKKTSFYLNNSKKNIFSCFLRSSFIFLVHVISIFSILSKRKLTAFQLYFFFLLLDLAYCLYVNYNIVSISYYIDKNNPKDYTNSITLYEYFIVLIQTVQNYLFSIFSSFYHVLGFICIKDFNEKIKNGEQALKSSFKRKSNLNEISFVFMGINKGRDENNRIYTIDEKEKLDETPYLKIFAIRNLFVRVPIHLTLFFLMFHTASFTNIKQYNTLGPLAHPVELLGNLFYEVSIESMSKLLSYFIVFLLFVGMQFSYLTSEISKKKVDCT